MNTDQIMPLVDISTRISTHISAMITMEQQKREALLQYDMEQTTKLMQNQQAMVMQLDIMEKKRITTQIDAGFSSMSCQEILGAVSSEQKLLLAPIFDELRFLSQELQLLNKVSLDIAKTELRLMGQSTTTSSSGLYQSNGKKRGASFNSTSFQETF